MKVRNLFLATIILSLLAGIVDFQPTHALGSPQILSISPGSPQSAGTRITIRVGIAWDDEYRAMRICFPDRNNCQESSETEFERRFNTDGWHVIRFWEHEIRKDPKKCVARLQEIIESSL